MPSMGAGAGFLILPRLTRCRWCQLAYFIHPHVRIDTETIDTCLPVPGASQTGNAADQRARNSRGRTTGMRR